MHIQDQHLSDGSIGRGLRGRRLRSSCKAADELQRGDRRGGGRWGQGRQGTAGEVGKHDDDQKQGGRGAGRGYGELALLGVKSIMPAVNPAFEALGSALPPT